MATSGTGVKTGMNTIISIFGSSRAEPGDESFLLAAELGSRLAASGFTVATGGYAGTMEAVSRGAAQAGGRVIGVVAAAISNQANSWVNETVVVPQWEDRLLKLISLGAGYVALPGGTGTLVELAVAWEMMHKRRLEPKPLIALGDFWRPVVEHIERFDPRSRALVRLAGSIPEAVAVLQEALPAAASPAPSAIKKLG
jgi:uncharacterized protein (TIGR00730 family)